MQTVRKMTNWVKRLCLRRSKTTRGCIVRCAPWFIVSKNSTRCKRGNSHARLRFPSPNIPVSPFGNPFDKILRQIAHTVLRPSHTICRKISLYVSASSAHVHRCRRISTFSTVHTRGAHRKMCPPDFTLSRKLLMGTAAHGFPLSGGKLSAPKAMTDEGGACQIALLREISTRAKPPHPTGHSSSN